MGTMSGSCAITGASDGKEKVSMHPSHVSEPRLSYECPPRAPVFNARVEFAL